MFDALVRYARTRPDLPPSCYRIRKVGWVLDIRQDRVTIEPYSEPDAVPTMRRSGANPMPLLAVDQACYVLGASGDTVTEKQAHARTAAFWEQLGRWMTGPNSHPAAGAGLTLLHMHGAAASEHAVPERDNVAVRVEGIWLHRLPEAQAEWLRIIGDLKGGPTGLCIACGQVRVLARSLPNSIPAHLVPGADKEVQLAVLPLAERQAGHLPVCIACADLAASALQTLLEDKTRTSAIRGQSSVTTTFGLGSPEADAEVAEIMRQLGVR